MLSYPGANFGGYRIGQQATTPINSPLSGGLDELLQQLIGPHLMGANKVSIPRNQVANGYFDPQGNYHFGNTGPNY